MIQWIVSRRQERQDRRKLLILWTISTLTDVSGITLFHVTRLSPMLIYALLDQLESDGFVTSDWETPEPHSDGAPRCRFYSMTDSGCVYADILVHQLARRKVPDDSGRIH